MRKVEMKENCPKREEFVVKMNDLVAEKGMPM